MPAHPQLDPPEVRRRVIQNIREMMAVLDKSPASVSRFKSNKAGPWKSEQKRAKSGDIVICSPSSVPSSHEAAQHEQHLRACSEDAGRGVQVSAGDPR